MSANAAAHRSWAFHLWHAFALMTVFGLWFAIFRVSQPFGVVVSVSVVPTTLFRVGASMAGRRQKASWINALLLLSQCLLWFSVYVLSVGPVVGLTSVSLDSPFYTPIIWLHDNTFLAEPLEWYVRLWGGP